MNAILQFVTKHGYAVLFGALFAHQLDLPIPGRLFLLADCALAPAGRFQVVHSRQLLYKARYS